MTAAALRPCVGAGAAIVGRLPLAGAMPDGAVRSSSRCPSLPPSVLKSLGVGAPRAPTPPRNFRRLTADEFISDFYEIKEVVAESEGGAVLSSAVCRRDGRRVIVRSLLKEDLGSSRRAWRAAMSQLLLMAGAPRAVDICEVVEDGTHFYTVMPACEGGDLWQFVEDCGGAVPENKAKAIIRQLLRGLDRLHCSRLIHQDLGPESVMLDGETGPNSCSAPSARIVSFDLCQAWTPEQEKAATFRGAPGFTAPEALLGAASPQSDLWAVGAILYLLVTGRQLWPDLAERAERMAEEGDCDAGGIGAERTYRSMRARQIDWDAEPWSTCPMARGLCQELLAFEPRARPRTAALALRHPWLDSAMVDRPPSLA